MVAECCGLAFLVIKGKYMHRIEGRKGLADIT